MDEITRRLLYMGGVRAFIIRPDGSGYWGTVRTCYCGGVHHARGMCQRHYEKWRYWRRKEGDQQVEVQGDVGGQKRGSGGS